MLRPMQQNSCEATSMGNRVCLATLLLCAAVTAHAAEWRFKSLRRPIASVSQNDGEWRIVVTFLPVSAFEDEAKNRIENERLAKTFAEWGLLRELGASDGQMLETSCLIRKEFSTTEESANAVFAVPVSNVRLIDKPKRVVSAKDEAEKPSLQWPDKFAEVKFDNDEIAEFLHGHPFFMEVGGVKVIRLADGRVLAIAIGMIDMAKPKTMRKKMAENRARTALVSEVHGIRTYTSSKHSELVETHVDGDDENAELFEESNETIISESAGWAPGLPIVGSWILKNDDQFCVAIGELMDAEKAKELLKTK